MSKFKVGDLVNIIKKNEDSYWGSEMFTMFRSKAVFEVKNISQDSEDRTEIWLWDDETYAWWFYEDELEFNPIKETSIDEFTILLVSKRGMLWYMNIEALNILKIKKISCITK